MNVCMTGCTSYVGRAIHDTLSAYHTLECISHTTKVDTVKKCDVLIHVGWLCDNESLKSLKSHISNVKYSLRLLENIETSRCIFISSFGAKWAYMFRDSRIGQILYNTTKRLVEYIYKLNFNHCLILRIPYVFDYHVKPGSIAYRMKYNRIVLDKPLPFVTRRSIANFILQCVDTYCNGIVDLVDLYAKTWLELDSYLDKT